MTCFAVSRFSSRLDDAQNRFRFAAVPNNDERLSDIATGAYNEEHGRMIYNAAGEPVIS